ncbi:hypothetical protein SRB5_21760 [Streptomyces sp. RB5]|uniref:Major facilitator superfamily (MFS) profile domain-containing protein n=1 Tax=Streptomyces smaragdinus TaxID=2585196 RepID=A0A7K0CF04_9ACTN|nr:hypothetical protein [Streptomyces smaragdinus]
MRGTGGGTLLASSLAGARQLLGLRRVRLLMLLFWLPPMFSVAPEALVTPYTDSVGAGTVALGLLMCALPVGTIAGEVLAGTALGPGGRARVVAPLAAARLVPYLLYALHPGVPVAAVVLAVAGLAEAYTLGLDRMFVDAVPEELRGRAMTLLQAGLMTIQGLGMAAAGAAAEFVPVQYVVAGAGALGTVCVLLVLAGLRRTEG